MNYGTLKLDTLVYTSGGFDSTVTVSGLANGASGVFPSGTAAATAITVGSSGNGLYSPGTNEVAISTSGVGRLFVNSDGTVSVGNSLSFSGVTSLGLRASTNTAVGNLLVLQKSNDGTNPANISFCKSRGTALSPTAVISQDVVAALFGQAYDGTTYQSVAGIKYVVEGITGTNDISCYITLDTRPSGVSATTQERMRITSDGKVGIGTSTPFTVFNSYKTIAGGNPATSGTTDDNVIARIQGLSVGLDIGGTAGGLQWIQPRNVNSFATNYGLALCPNGGNVGVGTTSPQRPLDVNGSVRLSSGSVIEFGGTVTNYITGDNTNNYLAFGTNSSERARIDSSGRLLVGTSSDSATSTLTVQGNSGSSSGAAHLRMCIGSATPANGDGLGYIIFGDSSKSNAAYVYAERDGGTWSGSSKPTRLVFSTTADGASSPTERLRIQANGRITLGGGAEATQGTVSFYPNYSAGAGTFVASTPLLYWNRANSASTGTACLFQNSGTTVGTITYTNSATAYNTSSDYRLKENVTPVIDGISRLQQLKPSRFNFIADPDHTVDGFIAHEVQSVVPEAITGTKDEVDADGKPVYQGIDQSKLVPLLTAALQEAVAKIESLEARLTAAGI